MTTSWADSMRFERERVEGERERARRSHFADSVSFYVKEDRRVEVRFTGIDYEVRTVAGDRLGLFASAEKAREYAIEAGLTVQGF